MEESGQFQGPAVVLGAILAKISFQHTSKRCLNGDTTSILKVGIDLCMTGRSLHLDDVTLRATT